MASERRLAEIRERLAAATPGPWELYATERNVIAITKGRTRSGYLREIVHWSGFDCSNIDDTGKVRANAALIAHAPSDLAYLLDEIARLSRELEAAKKLLRELVDEGAGLVWTGTRVVCAYCSATDQYDVEHNGDCPIERARLALAKDTEVSHGE